MQTPFNAGCRRCPRLVNYRKQLKKQFPEYHCQPVPAFGAEQPALLIVGLAPGLHGANATGRPFTGDASGDLLFKTLFALDLCNLPVSSQIDDGMQLSRTRITNAVKCLPPENKPIGSEVAECGRYLHAELRSLRSGTVIVALGRVAHEAIIKACDLKQRDYNFAHAAQHPIQLADKKFTLIDSYHCSRYNIQTKRLTPEMFLKLFQHAKTLLQ